MAKPTSLSHKPYRKVAWTQPFVGSFKSSNATGLVLRVPFKLYRLRCVMLTILDSTETGSDTVDLQGWDISAGSANADMFTFTAAAVVDSRTYVLHADKKQAGYYTSGTTNFQNSDSLQIVPKEKNLFSTTYDENVPAENRGMLPYLVWGGSPTAVYYEGYVVVDPVDDF
jgi:hypothetical protein